MNKLILKNELKLLMKSNGNIQSAIAKFMEKCPGAICHKALVAAALGELQRVVDNRFSKEDSQEELGIERFLQVNHRLWDIIENMGAGGVYDGIIFYSSKLRRYPGAVVNDQLSEWAKNLLLRAGYSLVVCRSRENSLSPPY